jgi:hypothetical protein
MDGRKTTNDAASSPEKRDKLGTRSNEHGFEKTSILRHRERRGLPFGGGGWRRDAAVWPEKLVGEFAGTQAVYDELRRGMEGATSDGSRWGFRIWNQRIEENTGIYI